MELAAKRHQVEDIFAAQELFHSNGWTDGLPVVPPTADAVAACLDWAGMPASQLIGVEPVRERPVSAEKLAINAIMAGCLPMHFPVVVAAWTAMMQPEFLLHGASASTGGCAILLIGFMLFITGFDVTELFGGDTAGAGGGVVREEPVF